MITGTYINTDRAAVAMTKGRCVKAHFSRVPDMLPALLAIVLLSRSVYACPVGSRRCRSLAFFHWHATSHTAQRCSPMSRTEPSSMLALVWSSHARITPVINMAGGMRRHRDGACSNTARGSPTECTGRCPAQLRQMCWVFITRF